MYIYVQVLPVYAESLGASLTVVGLVVASYAVPQLILRIPIGIWSDYLGSQKPLMMAGIGCILAGSIGLGFSPSPLFLGLSRLMVGVGAAVWALFPIYLVGNYSADNIGKSIGMLNFIVGASLVAASIAGGLIAGVKGEKFVFFVAAGLSIAGAISLLFTRERPSTETGLFSWHAFSQVARNPLLIIASVMAILLFFAEFASIWGFVPVYAARLGASDAGLGVLTMLVTIGSMAGSLIITPLIRRFGQVFSIIFSSIMLGLALVAVPFIRDLNLLGLVLTLNGIGFGMLSTQLMVLSIYNIEAKQRATAMGFYQAVYAIGMLTGPLISGFLSNHFGLSVVFYVAGALGMLIAALAHLPAIPGRHPAIKEN